MKTSNNERISVMQTTALLKQEFRGKKWSNSSLPQSIGIVGLFDGEDMKVYIAKDWLNYPRHFVEQYYNL